MNNLEWLEDWISGYQGSEKFLFLDVSVKEPAPQIIHSFFSNLSVSTREELGGLNSQQFETALFKTARLSLPVEGKKQLIHLLSEFFSFLGQSAIHPQADQWEEWILQLENLYLSRLRDDGSVKGETHQKKYSDVGRNDPCPCGSGKKFKKCCLNTIS